MSNKVRSKNQSNSSLQKIKKTEVIEPQVQTNDFDYEIYVKNGISKEEIIPFKEFFDVFDKDKNGTIDLQEMKGIVEAMKLDENPDKILSFFDNLDKDKDNKVDFAEFLEIISIYKQKPENDQEMKHYFNKFANGKDKITAEDLKKIGESVGLKFTDEEYTNMILCGDTDNDKTLDLNEFKVVLEKASKIFT